MRLDVFSRSAVEEGSQYMRAERCLQPEHVGGSVMSSATGTIDGELKEPLSSVVSCWAN